MAQKRGIQYLRVRTIPHRDQRYETVGDWFVHGEEVHVLVSDLGDWRMNFCIAFHEALEAALCINAGVDEETVTTFDELYEHRRVHTLQQNLKDVSCLDYQDELQAKFGCTCVPTSDSEPGEDVHAPYRKQHAVADIAERLAANALGLVWNEYADKVESV